jgi:hypothetical protein
MAYQVDNCEKIAALEEIRNSGILQITNDGVTVRYRDIEAVDDAIRRLKQEDTVNGFSKRRRIKRIDMGGY